MVTRRSFFAYAGGTTLTLFASGRFGIRQALAQVPGGSLEPSSIPKYGTPLLIPPPMPRAGLLGDHGVVDYYEIAVRQFQQQILPVGLPKTTVLGYGPNRAISPKAPIIFNAPSLTIEADAGRPVRIKWINQLVDGNGNYLPHLLPIDPTLHWANPPGGLSGRDSRPTFASTPGRYTGPVPMIPHVHGAIGVGDESDGYAEAWWLPAARNVPAGYATRGSWYNFFAAKAKAKFGVSWGPGFATFQYPNEQRAATTWYHDHTLGMTGKNVYAGPAGFYIVRGGPAGDASVRDRRTGHRAILPGPAPSEIDQFLPNPRTFREIPIAIQDRSFNADGSLFYPDSRAFFDGITGPYIPFSDVSPIHNPEFFGNCMMVNGATWPHLDIEPRRYRLRLLNGCDSRTLVLKFDDPRVQVWQIGNETGFLAAPANINATPPDASVADAGKAVLLMGNAERADLIVDFTRLPAGTWFSLLNVGPDSPFGGFPIAPDDIADPRTTGQVMEFRALPATGTDLTTPAQFLQLPAIAPLPDPIRTRRLALVELTSPTLGDIPVETRLGTVDGFGDYTALRWGDPVSENPAAGDTEIWESSTTRLSTRIRCTSTKSRSRSSVARVS
jgi:FtsP/CotA-like multicopper oxidase with cupredoxin domain